MTVHVVGVRHHSPACARLVRAVIAAVKPAHVLIEGPADLNERLDELYLSHTLPIAIFSFARSEVRRHMSWTPFCATSPEWVALREGRKRGARVRFMDLPAHAKAFDRVQNRYADRTDRYGTQVRALCQRLGVDGSDALWDHLFEQPMEIAELAAALDVYFHEIRGDELGGADDAREAFMAQCIAAAASEGDVVAVCGGWHKPMLENAWQKLDPVWPELPAVEEEVGSYLVPYTFKRLDSFVGYQSGMPSPEWYEAVWAHGPKDAPELMLRRAVKQLRHKKQRVSAADLIAVHTMMEGLMRLRGHGVPARVDLLDALACGLIKEALDVPLPWLHRGKLRQGTHPVLVEITAVFSGDRKGKLDPRTPRPPLLADVRADLDALDLEPPSRLTLDLTVARDRERSRALHRLRVLEIPGFQRRSGPALGDQSVLEELWELTEVFETESSLIEAASWGPTLETAALARIEARLDEVKGLSELAAVLMDAVFVGIDGLTDRVMKQMARGVGQEGSLGVIGSTLALILTVWRHDVLLGAGRSGILGAVIEVAWDRGLWLFDEVCGPEAAADAARIGAAVAMRDTLRFGEGLRLVASSAHDVMRRRSTDREAPPAMQGAALGFLWSTGGWADPDAAETHARTALLQTSRPKTVGDFLSGLFALAREEVLGTEALQATIDDLICGMDGNDFLIALPALRQAFEYFPPKEREVIAKAIIARRGETISPRSLVRGGVNPDVLLAGIQLEEQIDIAIDRWGLRK